MSLLTTAATAPAIHGKPCSVGVALPQLDPESRADFDAWMDGKLDLTDSQIHAALQTLGHRVSLQTVGRHRRGQCRCAGGDQ